MSDRLLAGAHAAYFLDIDGTLVELAQTPGAVRIGAALLEVIEALARRTGGAVALISGRALPDIDQLFPRRRLAAAGQHGIERRSAAGAVTRHRVSAATLNRVRRVLSTALIGQGLLLEDKGQSLALHYRQAPRQAGVAHRTMRRMLALAGPRYVLQRGKWVIELKPAGRDKGMAIAEFMREPPFLGRTPIFVGDDATDEQGFAVVNRMGGCSVKVGPGPTAAGWRLPDARAVVAWLASGRSPQAPVRVRRPSAARRQRPRE